MSKPSRPPCDHLLLHRPRAEFKWRCVKCGAQVRRRKYRPLVYSSTAAKQQAEGSHHERHKV